MSITLHQFTGPAKIQPIRSGLNDVNIYDLSPMSDFSELLQVQPRSQGLSSLSPLVAGTETLAAAAHVTTQNLGGRKICWKGGVFYRPLDQMYLSTHQHCGFG